MVLYIWDSEVEFWIGARDFTGSAIPFSGIVDKANVWDKVLTPGQRASIVAQLGITPDSVEIVGISPVSGSSAVKMVVDAQGMGPYYPLAKTDLVSGTWTNVAHSDDGVNSFTITNLDYSTSDVSGTNEVIYLQATNAAKFFKVSAE